MGRMLGRVVGAVALWSLLIGGGLRGAAAQGGMAGVRGTTYQSPTYGYALTWRRPWTVKKATSTKGNDFLELGDGVSLVGLFGYPSPAQDDAACLRTAARAHSRLDGVSDFRPANGQSGKPLAGTAKTGAWAAYTYTYTDQDGAQDRALFVLCHVLQPGQTALEVDQIVALDRFNDEVKPRTALLAGLRLPPAPDSSQGDGGCAQGGDSGSGADPSQSGDSGSATDQGGNGTDQTGGGDSTGGDQSGDGGSGVAPSQGDGCGTTTEGDHSGRGRSYVSPTYGYKLTVDPAWHVVTNSSKQGDDLLSLTNGVTRVAFLGTATFGDDIQACRDAFTGALAKDAHVGDLAVATDQQGQPQAGVQDTMAWELDTLTWTDDQGQAEDRLVYTGCRVLVPGQAALLVQYQVPLDQQGGQAKAINALLHSLTLPSAS